MENVTKIIGKISAINGDNTTSSLSNSTAVKTDISIKVALTMPVAEASVNANNFKVVKGDNTIVPLRITQSDDKKTINLVPTTSLAANTNYKVVVEAGLASRDGKTTLAAKSETSFKTGDFVTVSGFRAGGVTVDTAIVKGIFSQNVQNTDVLSLSFPVSINPSTVNATNVKVLDKNGVQVPAVVSYNDTNKTINIELGQTLGLVATMLDYSVVVNGLKTADGKSVEDYKYDFVVSTDFAPVVQLADGTAVNANAGVYARLATENYAGIRRVGFKLNVAFRATANGSIQAMQADTLNANNVWLEEAATGTKIAADLEYNSGSRVLSIVPKADLKENTQYRVVVLPDVRNSVGLKAENVNQGAGIGGSGVNFGTLAGATRYTQSFTTGYFVRPNVVDSSIKQGAAVVLPSTNTITVRFDKNLDAVTPSVATLIANKAIKLVDNSLNEEEIVLGTGAGDGHNSATVTINGNTLSIQFGGGKSLMSLVDRNNQVNGAAYNATTNNRLGHTFTLYIGGESALASNALRDRDGNPLAEDYRLTFSVPAADTVAPTVSTVKAMSNEDGAGSSLYKVELSKTATISNIQGNGTAVANEALQVVFGELMGASATTAANYTLDIDANRDGVYETLGTAMNTATNPSGDLRTIILTPALIGDIPNYAKVRLNIAAAVADLSGNTLGAPQQYVFTTGAGPVFSTADGDAAGADVASLPLSFATAAQGLTSAGATASLEGTRNSLLIAFDTLGGNAGNVNATTLTTDNIIVKEKATGNVVSGKLYSNVACNLPVVANTNAVYFKPDAAWASGKTYTVTLKSGIKDATLGNVSTSDYTYEFTTADTTTAPSVVETSIVNGQGGVGVDSTFKIKFSTLMNKTLVEAATAGVPDNVQLLVGGTPVAGKVTYDAATMEATFTPSCYLATGTQYTLRVSTAVQALNTNPIAENYDVVFGTSAVPKLLKITSAVYKDNTAANSDRITLTFDRPVNTAVTSAADGTSFVINGGTLAGGTYTWSADLKTLVISAITDAGTSIVPGVTTFQINNAADADSIITAFDNNGAAGGGTAVDTVTIVTITE